MGPGNKQGSTWCNLDLTGQYKQSPTLSSSHREECLSLEWWDTLGFMLQERDSCTFAASLLYRSTMKAIIYGLGVIESLSLGISFSGGLHAFAHITWRLRGKLRPWAAPPDGGMGSHQAHPLHCQAPWKELWGVRWPISLPHISYRKLSLMTVVHVIFSFLKFLSYQLPIICNS